jgi:hypothetical protein
VPEEYAKLVNSNTIRKEKFNHFLFFPANSMVEIAIVVISTY